MNLDYLQGYNQLYIAYMEATQLYSCLATLRDLIQSCSTDYILYVANASEEEK